MTISIKRSYDVVIVNVSGDVNSNIAGLLYDRLVGCIDDGWRKLILDLADAPRMTRAGAPGVLVAAKLLRSAGGRMRICNAAPQVEEFLLGLGFNHLVACDPTLEASVAALSSRGAAAPDVAA